MHKHFHCPAGHHWTVSFEGPSTLPLESISCPICGGLAETLTGEPGLQNDTEAPPISESLPELPGYLLVEVLGRGGMGVVFRARQVGLDRTVAVKMIRDELLAGPVERLRFRVEAEAAARIQHENIVRIHEVGEHQGRPFISMEFVPGGTLSRKLAGAPQLPRAAAEMIETLARAIHVAHECKIVHRDLKPGNILLAPDGTPKIVDFGLAKRLEPGPGLTHTGIIMGTPSYMAPEQAAGKSQNVGPAADIYALGAILYEMLTGRPPFRAASTLDTLNQIIKEEPVSPTKLQSRIPFDLEVICLKCLHKQPDRRYASARELADDLNRYLTGRPIVARPSGWPEAPGAGAAASRLWPVPWGSRSWRSPRGLCWRSYWR